MNDHRNHDYAEPPSWLKTNKRAESPVLTFILIVSASLLMARGLADLVQWILQ